MSQLLGVFRPFGIDLFCLGKKFLVFNLVDRNLKVKYRRSFFGVFWTLLAPMAMAAIYYFVFKVILNVQIPNYLPFLLSGVLPWAFFAQTLAEGMECLVISMGLLTKVPVPLQVFPFVGAVTNLVTLALALPVLVGVSILSGVELGWELAVVPYLFLCLFLLAYGLSLILAIAFVYLRDLRHVLGIILQLWFYATPVLYSEDMVPERYQWVQKVNPAAPFFNGMHAVFAKGEWPAGETLVLAAVWGLTAVVIGALVQRTLSAEVVENL